MTTLNQRIVIDRIKSKLGKSRIRLSEEMKGIYSPIVCKTPANLTKTKAYQEEIIPILQKMEIERNRAIDLLQKKISKAQYSNLISAVDILTKNIQLLGGKPTENILNITISASIAKKNAITQSTRYNRK